VASSTRVVELRSFNSVRELLSKLDEEISELNAAVRSLEAKRAELESKIARYKKFEEALKSLTGRERVVEAATVEIAGMKVLVDPRPIDEVAIIDEALPLMRDKASVLTKVRELIDTISTRLELMDSPIMVEFQNGIPIKLVVKL